MLIAIVMIIGFLSILGLMIVTAQMTAAKVEVTTKAVEAQFLATSMATDAKLEVIRIDVNSNLSLVKAQLAAALTVLNEDRESRGLEPITPEMLVQKKE